MICGSGTILFHQLKHVPVRLEQSVSLEEGRGSRCLKGCVPAAAPSLGGDTACWCAGCESGRAAGKPGRTEQTTEPSHTTETPEDTSETWPGHARDGWEVLLHWLKNKIADRNQWLRLHPEFKLTRFKIVWEWIIYKFSLSIKKEWISYVQLLLIKNVLINVPLQPVTGCSQDDLRAGHHYVTLLNTCGDLRPNHITSVWGSHVTTLVRLTVGCLSVAWLNVEDVKGDSH